MKTMMTQAVRRVSHDCFPLISIQEANNLVAIESRVARIKARVAELTGTMEGTSVPGTPQVPQSPAPEPTSPAHN